MKLDVERVIYTVECLPEDTNHRRELEAREVAWVDRQFKKGNRWAWCIAKVTATVQHPTEEGETLTGVDYLGQCMYLSREHFIIGDGYYSDMKQAALTALQEAWDDAVEAANEVQD